MILSASIFIMIMNAIDFDSFSDTMHKGAGEN
jgi:hypothetical protein